MGFECNGDLTPTDLLPRGFRVADNTRNNCIESARS
jgi:hypothetical protein